MITKSFSKFSSLGGLDKVFVTLLINLVFLAVPAVGQCCLGAQNSVTDSHNGRYRVEATSLTGTGPENHGPYKFRFRMLLVKGKGKTEELGVFERSWDTTQHFNMDVYVSPTGNGFGLSLCSDQHRFYSPDGEILSTVGPVESTGGLSVSKIPSLLYLRGKFEPGRRTTRVWLPFFHITGPETEYFSIDEPEVIVTKDLEFTNVPAAEIRWLRRMLVWSPEQGKRDRNRVIEMIEKTDEAGLINLGLSALPFVEAKIARRGEPALSRVRAEIINRLCGHREPWRNLELLVELLDYPDKDMLLCVQGQLRALIPTGEPNAKWINKNREHLTWDPKQGTYQCLIK